MNSPARQDELFGVRVSKSGQKKPPRPLIRELVRRAFELAGSGGLTVDQVEVAARLRHQTASARVHELEKAGALVRTKERRRTRTGATAWVFRVAGLVVGGAL